MGLLKEGTCYICGLACYKKDTVHVECSRKKWDEWHQEKIEGSGDMQDSSMEERGSHESEGGRFDSTSCNTAQEKALA